jgi:ketosteroid isomerase-like protein
MLVLTIRITNSTSHTLTSMKAFAIFLSAASLLTFSTTEQVAALAKRPATTTAAHALSPDEQLFTDLIGQVSAAIQKRDMNALGQFMTPDYIHYTPDNHSGGRAEELAYVGQWAGTTVKQVTPLKVTRRGDMAVTVGTTTFSGEFKGKPFKNTVNMMIAWVLQDGKWQMAVVQSKLVPA